jgi:CBS-domain-containing membrane protein
MLFIAMLYTRRSLRGQSGAVAISKTLGTALASLAFYFYSPLSEGSIFAVPLHAILVFDLIYVVVVSVRRVAGAGGKEEHES